MRTESEIKSEIGRCMDKMNKYNSEAAYCAKQIPPITAQSPAEIEARFEWLEKHDDAVESYQLYRAEAKMLCWVLELEWKEV